MLSNKLNPLSKMAIPYLNFTEKSFKNYLKISSMKLKPFRPILLSIFLYFAMFYIFRFSPSTLVCTTKFWFFISNTLILVIAADFDAFSSSEKQEYISQEYEIKNDTRLADMNMAFEATSPSDKKYSTIFSATHDDDYHNVGPETAEKEIENDGIKQEGDNAENPEEESEEKLKDSGTTGQEVENEGSTTTQNTISVAETEGKGESLSDQNETHVAGAVDTRFEEDEFSSMSVEELNTRAEDFIRRIHRQIRLQVVDNRRNLSGIHRFK